MRTTLLAAALFAALLPSASASAQPVARPVKVERTTYDGWPQAVRISNGIVEAIVVPQIGRILAFRWVGQPKSDPIFVNMDWAGKSIADAPAGTWANFGGDKLWPSPQSDWPKHAPAAWPPDSAFDGGPETAETLPNGVTLTTPWSSAFAARAVRTITMRPGEARLYIDQKLEKDPAAAGEKNGFDVGIWSITQTRPDGLIFLPLPPGAPPGYKILTPAPGGGLSAGWEVRDGLLVGRRDPVNSLKVGSPSGAGWLASLYGGDVLFSEHFVYQPGQSYPDGGLPEEVWTNGGDTAYIELELLSPLSPLTGGQSEEYNIYWQLDRLPHAPSDLDEACRLVTAAMAR